MKRPVALWLLVLVLGILALGGLAGASAFLSDPSGGSMGMDSQLDQLPFQSYLLPGLLLLILMTGVPVLLIYGLLARPEWPWTRPIVAWSGGHWAWAGSLILGIGLFVWLTVQAAYIGFAWPIQWFTGGLDLAILGLTMHPSVRKDATQAVMKGELA